MDGESIEPLLTLENLSSFFTDPSLLPPTSLLPHQTHNPNLTDHSISSSLSSALSLSSSSSQAVLLPADEEGNISGNKERDRKRGGGSKQARVEFQTRSVDDILDDGYRWRKYGQKSVKNNAHPRSYYRCTYHTCNVKKQIQRLAKDPSIVVTTYEGVHNHPCEKLMQSLSPLLRQLEFLSRIGNEIHGQVRPS